MNYETGIGLLLFRGSRLHPDRVDRRLEGEFDRAEERAEKRALEIGTRSISRSEDRDCRSEFSELDTYFNLRSRYQATSVALTAN